MENSSDKQGNPEPSFKNQSPAPSSANPQQKSAASRRAIGGYKSLQSDIPSETIRIILTGDEQGEIADEIESLFESERIHQETLAKLAAPTIDYSPTPTSNGSDAATDQPADNSPTESDSAPDNLLEPNSSPELIPEAIVELSESSGREAPASIAESVTDMASESPEPVAQVDTEPLAEVYTEPVAEPADQSGTVEPASESDKDVPSAAAAEPGNNKLDASTESKPDMSAEPESETQSRKAITPHEQAKQDHSIDLESNDIESSELAVSDSATFEAGSGELDPVAKTDLVSCSDESPSSTGFVLVSEPDPWETTRAQERSDNVIETSIETNAQSDFFSNQDALDFYNTQINAEDKFPDLPSAEEELAAFDQMAAEERERRTAPADLSAEDLERLKELKVTEAPASEDEIAQRKKLQKTTSSLKVAIHNSQEEGMAQSERSRKMVIIGLVAVCASGMLALPFLLNNLNSDSSRSGRAGSSSTARIPAEQLAIKKSSSASQVGPSNRVDRVVSQPPPASQESYSQSNEAPFVLPPGQTSYGSGQSSQSARQTSQSASQTSHVAIADHGSSIPRQPPAPLAFAYEKIHLSSLIAKAKKLGLDTSKYSAALIEIQHDSHANKHQGELAEKMKALSAELEALIETREPPKTEICHVGMGIGLPGEMPKEGADQEGYMSTKISSTTPLIVKGLHESVSKSGSSLKTGDRIISIDGVSVDGMSIYEIENKLSGTKGTEVKIQFKKADDDSVETVKLIRNNKTRFEK